MRNIKTSNSGRPAGGRGKARAVFNQGLSLAQAVRIEGMDKSPRQFSLRFIFGLTVVIAVAMFYALQPEAIQRAGVGIGFSIVGAIFARIDGGKFSDVLLGAFYGFLIGTLITLTLPAAP